MLHQVLKKFKTGGRELKPGDIVETSGWKNERLLLEHRYIGKPSVPQKDASKIVDGGHVEPTMSSGAISKPELPKATPQPAVKPVLSGKPAVLRTAVPAVGKVPVAKEANQVKTNG